MTSTKLVLTNNTLESIQVLKSSQKLKVNLWNKPKEVIIRDQVGEVK